MKKINVLSNYRHAKIMLDNRFDYSLIEKIKLYKYLFALKINEEKQDGLKLVSKVNASFNDCATSFILNEICRVIKKDKKQAFIMIEKESKRIQKVINSYSSKVEPLSFSEMKSILGEYMDEDSSNNLLDALYESNDKILELRK